MATGGGRRHVEPVWPMLLAGTVGALWRWRLEVGLITLPALVHGALADLLGEPAGWLMLTSALGAGVAAPACRRRLLRALRAARVRRRWRRAWMDCGLAPVRAGRVTAVPAGELVRIRAARGSSLGAVADRAEQLAVCLALREVRVTRDAGNAARGSVTLVRRDPLDRPSAPWPQAATNGALSLWDPIPVGVDEHGRGVQLALPERNVLLGGEPGAGKSAALSMIVATGALDPSVKLWLLDGKLVELAAWAPCAERVAGVAVGDAIELLRELRTEMDERYRHLLAGGLRKVGVNDGFTLHLVACDELAFYLTAEDRKQRAAFAELLRDIVARGRAAGIIVAAATQKPAADVIPSALRDLFGFRWAMRCNTPQASDTILGQGWASVGYSAARINPGQRGVGYLLAEDGLPVRMRACYVDDQALGSLSARAAELRGP